MRFVIFYVLKCSSSSLNATLHDRMRCASLDECDVTRRGCAAGHDGKQQAIGALQKAGGGAKENGLQNADKGWKMFDGVWGQAFSKNATIWWLVERFLYWEAIVNKVIGFGM